MSTSVRERVGFTLIELLVVIAIIGILAAILFPVFVAAKEASKKSACQGNLKQIGVALQMYADDYAGTLPAGDWISVSDPYIQWWTALDRYVMKGHFSGNNPFAPNVRAIWLCPSLGQYFGYGWNWMYFGYTNNDHRNGWATKLGQVQKRSAIIIGDGPDKGQWGYGCGNLYYDNSSARHSGGANFLSVDGHVKWYLKSYADSHPRLFRQSYR